MSAMPSETGVRVRETEWWLRPAVFAPLLASAAAIVSIWYGRQYLPFQDEGGMLALSSRILHGGVFYRDLDAYALPGANYLLAGCMALFGDHLRVARGLAGALFCGSLLALYASALAVVDRRSAAAFALSLLSLKFLAWPMYTSFVHGDTAYFFAWVGIACFLHSVHDEKLRMPRLAAAGSAIALSILCKQNLGLYVAAAAVALLLAPGTWMGRASLGAQRGLALRAFAAAGAVPLALAAIWFATQGVLGAMLWSGFVRPLTGYIETSAVAYHPMLAWWELGSPRGTAASSYIPVELWRMLMLERLPGSQLYDVYWMLAEIASRTLYTLVPLTFVCAIVHRLRGAATGRDARLHALALLSLAGILAAFPRVDVLHLIPALPPIFLVLYALWRRTAGSWRFARVAELALLVSALGTSAALALHAASFLTLRVELKKADVWISPSEAWIEPLIAVSDRVIGSGEPFFVYGDEAQLYYLSDRYPPWPFVWLYPGMEGGDGGKALADALRRDPPKLIVRGMSDLPGLPSLPSYTREIEAFIDQNYAVDAGFFERNPGRGPEPPKWLIQVLRPRQPNP